MFIYAVVLCYTLNGAPDPTYPGGPCSLVHVVTAYDNAAENLALCRKETATFNRNAGYSAGGRSLREECRQRELPTWDLVDR